jgi:error-prone DNA polymerase
LPSIDRKFLLKLLQLEIAAHPPQAAVLSLTLRAEAGQSSKVQLGLFAPQMPEPSRLTTDERLAADYAGTGITTGPHPMAYHRETLRREEILSAEELTHRHSNQPVRIAGCVIARQRPGTAKGFVFLSLEDETGIANVILTPDVFERDRIIVTRTRFLLIEGLLQNQNDVIHVKAQRISPLDITSADISSNDFH